MRSHCLSAYEYFVVSLFPKLRSGMQKLRVEDLLSLEEYARERAAFRARVMAHKKHRRLAIGPNATLYFEDALTIRYQVQEMLRIERISSVEGVVDELDAYNPLIPDGTNLKATFMIEFSDEAQRRDALSRMLGIEEKIWLSVDALPPIAAIADEDLERVTEDKTAAVHFLRFEFTVQQIDALKQQQSVLNAGIDHPAYSHQVTPVALPVQQALQADFD